MDDGIDAPRPHPSMGVYAISVAAQLVGNGEQNLRLYEKRGLVSPARSDGGTRRYSEDDLTRLRRIGDLLGQGLNLAGVALVLDLEAENTRLRDRLAGESVGPAPPGEYGAGPTGNVRMTGPARPGAPALG